MQQLVCTTPDLDASRTAELLRELVTGVMRANELLLAWLDLPPLYESGVRFRREPEEIDSCPDIVTMYQRGFGDCAPLAAARGAELRRAGNLATIVLYWRPEIGAIHAEIRRADGEREDPARRLGMVGARSE